MMSRVCQPVAQIYWFAKTLLLSRDRVSKGENNNSELKQPSHLHLEEIQAEVSSLPLGHAHLLTPPKPTPEFSFIILRFVTKPKDGKAQPEKMSSGAYRERIRCTVVLGIKQCVCEWGEDGKGVCKYRL